MLGRGLESLIPPSNNRKPQDGGALPQQPITPPVNPVQPVFFPREESEPLLVGREVEPELPAAPVLEELPPAEILPEENHIQPVIVDEPVIAAPARVSSVKPSLPDRAIESVFQLEVSKIKSNPNQPRRIFDENGIRDLAASIREFGLLQPIVVTKEVHEVPNGTEVEYVLIAGERRLMATRLLGLETVPAIVRNVARNQESLELAIIENIQRENLNPIETARAFSRLQDEFRLTQREIATRLGKSREVVANTVRLLDLPPVVQDALERGQISESHGRLLLAVNEPALQEKLFQDLLHNRLTTRELRARVDEAKADNTPKVAERSLSPEIAMFQERLSSDLGAPVTIHQAGDTGKITITFYSGEELKHIIGRLSKQEDGY